MPLHSDERSLGLLLSRTYLAYKKKATQLLNPLDITPEQFGILHQLSKYEGMSQKKLASIHERDQTSIGKTLERLEKKQLISRHVDPADRRAVVVHLTAEGVALLQQAEPIMERLDHHIYDQYADKTGESLQDAVNHIYQNLSD